jgi:hypothetical protein
VDYVQAAAISEFFELFDLARQSVRIPERQGEGFWENSSFSFHHSFGVKDVTNCWTVLCYFSSHLWKSWSCGRGLLGRCCVSEAFGERGCLAGAGTGCLERAAVETDPDFDLRSRSRSAAFSVGIFLPRHPLGKPGASTVIHGMCATAIGELCWVFFGLFANLCRVRVAPAAFHLHRLCVTIPLRVVEPLEAVALGCDPLFVGQVNRDYEVADRPQF